MAHVDIKHPIGSKALIDQGRTVTIEDMGYEIGKKIVMQKNRSVGLKDSPVSPENVGHIVDLCYVSKNEKRIVRHNILKGARDQGSDAGIIFLNNK